MCEWECCIVLFFAEDLPTSPVSQTCLPGCPGFPAKGEPAEGQPIRTPPPEDLSGGPTRTKDLYNCSVPFRAPGDGAVMLESHVQSSQCPSLDRPLLPLISAVCF